MQNMTDITEKSNQSQQNPQANGMGGQYGTNMPMGQMGNQFGTNMPMGGGYN